LKERYVLASRVDITITVTPFPFKLGNHRLAISSLVNDLHDSISAEAYCMLGGEVIPAKAAISILESIPELLAHQQMWLPSGDKGPPRKNNTSDKLKEDLLKILLEVYMSDMWDP
jgi:hypothetical protein